MLLANVAISVVLTFIFHGLKNASPNGSRNVHSGIPGLIVILSLLPTFLVILGIILITNVGVYIGVTFLHTGVFYDLYFYIWLFVLLGVPILYFVGIELNYRFQLYKQAYYFTPLPLDIIHDYELLTTNVALAFLQTEKKLMATLTVGIRKDVEHIGKLIGLSVSERNNCLYEPMYGARVYIPKETNRLRISWYSVMEDTYYEDEIDFPFNSLVYVEEKYPSDVSKFLRGKKTDRVTLALLKGGRIELFNKQQILLEPVLLKSVVVSEEKKKHQIESLAYLYPKKNLPKQIEVINKSHTIEKRAELSNFQCNWQITGTGLVGHNIEIKDVRNNYRTSDPIPFTIFERRPLPIFFEIDYRKNTWLHIFIDAEKLFGLIQAASDKEVMLSFDFALDVETGAAKLTIKNNDIVLPFTAWEKKIIEHRWKEAKEEIIQDNAFIIKNNFLKEIYELLVAKEYVGAQQVCKKALEAYPYFPMIYFYEARLLWYTDGCEACYAKKPYFLEKTKTDPHALAHIYNHYGCLYDEEKRYAESLACFQSAHASYPKEVIYVANIAEVYYKMKNAKKALHYANKCIEKEFTSEMVEEIIANKGVMV